MLSKSIFYIIRSIYDATIKFIAINETLFTLIQRKYKNNTELIFQLLPVFIYNNNANKILSY